MYKITVLNAYGKKNIGDAAILNQSLSMLNKITKLQSEVTVLCEDKNAFDIKDNKKTSYILEQLPYGYAIKENGKKIGTLNKIVKLVHIIFMSSINAILLKLNLKSSMDEKFSYIKSIKNADFIIGMGGGYLISKHPYKDFFGLMLTVLPIYIAKFFNKKIFFLPMSFGPFAHHIHRSIALDSIKDTTVAIREDISLKDINNSPVRNKINILEIPDIVLDYPWKHSSTTKRGNYIVLTAREWLTSYKQQKFEQTLVELIEKNWNEHKLKTVFVSMAYNVVEDDDNRLAKRLKNNIKIKESFEIANVKNPEQVQKLLSKAKYAICTRMHSAILSYTTNTPFISIGYGHKAAGLMDQINLKEWYIDMDKVNFDGLYKRCQQLLNNKNYSVFQKKIKKAKLNLQEYFIMLEQSLRKEMFTYE